MTSMPFATPRLLARLVLATVLATVGGGLAAADTFAAAEPGPVRYLGTAVTGIAPMPDGSGFVVGADGSRMLAGRLAQDGTPTATYDFGAGRAIATAAFPDGSAVVLGDDGGPVVRRLTTDSRLDPNFGASGTARLPPMTPTSVATGPDGTSVVAGSVTGGDGLPRVALVRLTASGNVDPSFGRGGLAIVGDAGRNAAANAVVVLPGGQVVFAGQRAPGLQITEAIVGRVTTGGALDPHFATPNGVYAYDAQGGVRAAFFGLAIDATGRVLAGGADLRASGSLATVVRLSAAGVLDPGFGAGGVVRLPATVNTGSDELIGIRVLREVGSGEIAAVGDYQDSGRRSAALWTLTPAGALDPATGGGTGRVLTTPDDPSSMSAAALAAAPDGSLFAGGTRTSLDGTAKGFVVRSNGFGSLAPPFDRPLGPEETGAGPVGKSAAKLQVLGASIVGSNLRVLATISRRAVGPLSITYAAAGFRRTYTVRLKDGGRVSLVRRLPASVRKRSRTGLLTVRFTGSDVVTADEARLRVGPRAPGLKASGASIDQSGFLTATGSLAPSAKGQIRVRLDYVDSRGALVPLIYRAPVRRGRWHVEVKLPDAAATAGGTLAITYAGLAARGVRGAQIARSVAGVVLQDAG